MFTLRSRTVPTVDPEARVDRLDQVRKGLPPRFEAVAEALASGSGSVEAAGVVGTALAKDGAALDEALDALATTYRLVLGIDPAYDDVRALARAWSDATLTYLHQLACEDPMTGLASLAHVRSRLSELYRGEFRGSGQVRDTHALVVAELPDERDDQPLHGVGSRRALTRAMRLTDLGGTARTVFSGTETIGRLGYDRVVVIAERDDNLGQRVALMRRMARTLYGGDLGARVWIEGLPGTDGVAALLLDELARG